MDDVCLTQEKLDLGAITDLAGCPSCGAISTFIGTTRDNYKGKSVVHLEYEAYVPMAEQEMKKICKLVREKWDVKNIVMHHRLGRVPIGEASIIIAVSSCHRKESLEAVDYAIETLKANVPVWKKEMYGDGTCSWKENAECCWSNKTKD